MIGHDKPRLEPRPAVIAAAILGALAVGGLGWALGRASAGRPGPAIEVASGDVPAKVLPPAASTPRPGLVKRVPEPVEPSSPETVAKVEEPNPPAAADAKAAGPRAEERTEKPPGPARINLNTATAAELEVLPGIGPGLAQRIIEHRERAGRFRTVAELDKVKGIGPRTIEKLRALVSVE